MNKWRNCAQGNAVQTEKQNAADKLGYKFIPSFDAPGYDLGSIQTGNPVECLNKCRGDANCKGVAWSENDKRCWFKGQIVNAGPAQGRDVFIKN